MVYEGEKRDDAYKIVWDTIRLSNLEPHVYTSEEWQALKTKKWTGIIIYQTNAEN